LKLVRGAVSAAAMGRVLPGKARESVSLLLSDTPASRMAAWRTDGRGGAGQVVRAAGL